MITLSYLQIFGIGFVVFLIVMVLKNRTRINIIMNDPNVKYGGNLFKNTKEGLGWYYRRVIVEYSPLSFTIIGISVFYSFLYMYGDKSSQLMFWINLIICLPICYFMMRKLMDFPLIIKVDPHKSPYILEGWRMSHRVLKKYQLLDDKGQDCIMINGFKWKKGEGFFVDDIDHKKRIIKTNPFHNNVELVTKIKTAFKSLRVKCVELLHTNHELKANEEIRSEIKAVQILEKIHAIRHIALDSELEITDDMDESEVTQKIIELARRYLKKEGDDKDAA